jgi:hypothetical protein
MVFIVLLHGSWSRAKEKFENMRTLEDPLTRCLMEDFILK